MEQTYWLLLLIYMTFYPCDVDLKCVNNRKVYTDRTGYITDGLNNYGDDERCEWLIKGNIGETVTIIINSAHMEEGFDFLFIYDGGSRSSPLLGRLNGEHGKTQLISLSNMVYLMMFTDTHANKDGFNISYAINKCPANCSNEGTCKANGVCECSGRKYGKACTHEWCSNLCHQGGEGNNKCNVTAKKCTCGSNFYGEGCSISRLPNTGLGSWYHVSSWSPFFTPRFAHVCGYMTMHNVLLVHGGYNLNKIFDDMWFLNFQTNEWEELTTNATKPSARYLHTSVVYKDLMIVFGGELDNDRLSNELWLFNFTTKSWILSRNDLNIPALSGHSMTLVGNNIYVIGGKIMNGYFSQRIYCYHLEDRRWEVLSSPMLGKTTQLGLFGHSASYHEKSHSIVVYGGFYLCSINLSIDRSSNSIWIYNIKANSWLELKQRDSDPPPLVFHSAVIVEDYMIIQGGYVHYDNPKAMSTKTYYYNLHCHTWVDENVFVANSNQASFLTSRFSHTAVLKEPQTIIIVGGFNRLEALGDVLAYKLPEAIIMIPINPGGHCSGYKNEDSCINDPSCSFCKRLPEFCFSSYQPNLCQNAPMPTKCPRICLHFSSCESCTINNDCLWCPVTLTCSHISDTNGCGTEYKGWWGSNQLEYIRHPDVCQTFTDQPGLTFVRYLDTNNNLDYPDDVKIQKDFVIHESAKELRGSRISVHGYIYPYLDHKDGLLATFQMKLYARLMNISVNISKYNWITEQDRIGGLTSSGDDILQKTLERKDDDMFPVKNVSPQDARNLWYYISLYGDTFYSPSSSIYVDLRWNRKGIVDSISQSYLRAYYTGNCSNHLSCGSCVADSSCGWCSLKQECLSATSWKQCNHGNDSVYLTRGFSECLTCSDYCDCHSCAEDKFCSWSDSGCLRKKTGKSMECPISCYRLNDTDSCIKSDKCIWCTEKNLCIPLSQYSTHNKYGQCGAFRYRTTPDNCGKYTRCQDCLLNYTCGWCYDEHDPRYGRCTSGDFMSPNSNCSTVFENDMVRFNYSDSLSWAYEKCPDVNECSLGLDSCPDNSHCVNTYGSYECVCDQGFKDDGHNNCVKTCWPECVHGKCNNDSKCDCDLGWRGGNCSVDCGCNGHSTCSKQIGVCDKCQDYTFGEHCEFCVNRSYGNATTEKGCRPCPCHGHGDLTKNECDPQTGHCFCLNFTMGSNCSQCQYPFVGDPKIGACYLPCQKSRIITNLTNGYLRPANVQLDAFTRCLWVISAENTSLNDVMYKSIQSTGNVLLTIEQLSISCSRSQLVVYDGVPTNPRTKNAFLSSSFKMLGKFCGPDGVGKSFRSTTGILSVFYEGVSSGYAFSRSTPSPGFFAEFTLLRCPDNCSPPFICKSSLQGEICTCADGWHGDICQYEECPKSCSQPQGVCNKDTKKCECVVGFTGTDCSKAQKHYFVMNRRNARFLSVKQTDLPHYGSTMFEYKSSLHVYGGINVDNNLPITMLQFHLKTNEWKTSNLDVKANPNSRYHHCSFLYKNFFYIYGGYTQDGVTNELWRLEISSKTWRKIENTHSLPTIAAHTCTLIGSMVYVIGGFIPDDGLNEYVTTLELENLTIANLKFNGLEPTGLYSHIAVYDETSGKIFVHGGMAFFSEKVQQSDRVYVLHPNVPSWDYVEGLPSDPVPRLIGHVAHKIDDNVYILGGYSDQLGYNKDVFVWKLSCNKWIKLTREAGYWVGEGKSDRQFSSSTLVNNSIYMFSGFNTKLSEELTEFTPSKDLCFTITAKNSCLSTYDCHWCENQVSNKSSCYSQMKPSYCLSNSTIISSPKCTPQVAKNRDCSSYSSCTSCHSSHPQDRARCTWCRCERSQCISSGSTCPCAGVVAGIRDCEEAICETSTCRNCGGSLCMWTKHFEFHTELKRNYHPTKAFPYNCFRESLLKKVPESRDAIVSKCPDPCHTYTSCASCLSPNVHGDLAGSKHCYWSEKLSSCLSYALLPLTCSFGRCGQLYDHTMAGKCPKQCYLNTRCSSCFKDNACGWCSADEKGGGICLPGDFQGTWYTCGVSPADIDEPIVISNSSANNTWAYALCPLENECLNGHHNCRLNERCEDLPQGFSCVCKPGYIKSLADGSCKPVCHQGCLHGVCVAPDQCNCSFSWTSSNCSIPCECNGHSNCLIDDPTVCLKCENNTKGASCEECEPLYVGDSRNGSVCKSCLQICNNNAEVCMTKAQYNNLTDVIENNRTLLLEYLGIGLSSADEAFCINCTGFSEGNKCEICKEGYFQYEDLKCQRCMCNGHAFNCNRTTGEGCSCKQNTRSDAACKTHCYNKQCTKCVVGYYGEPSDGRQCYRQMKKDPPTIVTVAPYQTQFYYATPGYTNVDIRLVVDVMYGIVNIYIAKEHQKFEVEVNETTNTHTIFPVITRRRRSAERHKTITASQTDLMTYVEYDTDILIIKNLQKRLVIPIPHAKHDLSQKWFFIGVASEDPVETNLKLYYQQDLPRIDLMLFFLVLLVILLLILTGFILGWKIRHDWTRRVIAVQLQKEIETMANRPLAVYQLRLERNEDVQLLRNRKVKSNADKEKKSPSSKKLYLSQDSLLPLAVQNTSDNLASIYTVMIQYPENELSQWNLMVGGCLAYSQNQHLLFVKTSYNGLQGTKFNTRISSTAV